MADQRITELTELTKAGVAQNDVLPISDITASETKKVTVKNLVDAGLDLISTSSIDLDKLDQSSTLKIGTTALGDDAVTYAKIQNVSASNKLLGRISGVGAVEEIACTAAGRALLDDATAAVQRVTLDLGTSSNVTFSSVAANLTASTATITTATINGGTVTGITDITVADGGTGSSTAAGARTNLGLVIGTNVQAFDAGLNSISGLTTAANQSIYLTGADTYAAYSLTAAGRALLDDVDASAQRTTLGLGTLATQSGTFSGTSSGTNTGDQTITLTGAVTGTGTGSFATTLANTIVGTANIVDDAVTYAKIQDISATDIILGRSTAGAGVVEEIACTTAGRALLDDADAAAQRTTLGLGTLATQSGTFAGTHSGTSSGTNTGDQTITLTGAVTGTGTGSFATSLTGGIVDAAALASNAVQTAKIGDNQVNYAKIQDVTLGDKILGRDSSGAGNIQEIDCTSSGRALLSGTNAAEQRNTLGLGTLATQSGTFSGTTSGTNTGDQTIVLTGPVTGSGTGSFATSITAGAIGTTEVAADAITYDRIQNTTSTNIILGRSTAGAGTVEEIACTTAGRALLDDVNIAAQRTTLGLGNLAVATGTWTDGSSFAGTSSGTNTGDQTITLTGAVTGTGTGSFATTLASDIVAAANIQSSAVTTAKINDSAIDEDKLGDQSTCIVSTATPSGTGAFVGQAWYNTGTSIAYRWNGTAWTQEAGIQSVTVTESTPLSIAVNNPDNFTANITLTLDTQAANSVFVGPASGADAAPTFRALLPADLPDATATAKGIVQPGAGLSVSSGSIGITNSVTAATKSGITFNAQGFVTAAVDLIATDIPDLDAAKITTGAFASDRIAGGAITAGKLANKSTASIGETLPVAAFTGQLHFNPLDKNFFLWDGNVWQSIGISAGAIILAGTYDASTNQVASVTNDGSAIGLSVGNALPSSSSSNSNYYLVVSEPGTGTSPAPTVTLAPPDLLLSTGAAWLEIDVSSTYTAQTANNVAFSPAANLGSTNVQSALEEVSNECRDVDNMTGGTLNVARGGTNIASYAKGDLIAASASTTLNKLTVGANGYILSADSTQTTGLQWIANTVGTVTGVTVTAPLGVTNGTTTPALTVSAGSTSAAGVLQLTDGVASSSTTTAATPNGVKTAYDLAALAMPKAGGIFSGQVLIGNTGSLVFEGPTDDAFETTLSPADPTADRTITLPNSNGTVALTSQLDDGTF